MYYRSLIPSPLGDLVAIASDTHLLMLEFADSEELEGKISSFAKELSACSVTDSGSCSETKSPLSPFTKGVSEILKQTEQELREYFEGTRQHFDIPLRVDGTTFQKDAWNGLQAIPYGETRSYGEQAKMIGRDRAVRAIGGANHNNRIVIIIPCHRVIGASGKLVGYGGGLTRKVWLLEHEKRNK